MKIKKEKIKAIALRRKGNSYGQISKILNINKSTISDWLRNINWSQDIKKQLTEKSKETSRKRLVHLNKLKKEKWSKYYIEAEREASLVFPKLKNNKLFIAGVVIYWGEGDKTFKNGIVRVSNTDEKMLEVFSDFLQKICKVDKKKIRAGILLYPDIDPEGCLKFWSKHTKISEDRFFKSTIIKGRHKTKRLGNGVCIVSVSDKYFKKKLLTWLDLFTKEL